MAQTEFSLGEVFSGLAESILPAGTRLIRQGEASEFAYYLKSGSVTVFTENKFGSVSLATIHAPQLIGEIGVLARLPRTASIKAASDISVVRISADQLLEVGARNPALLFAVISQLGRQIDAVNKTVGLYTTALSALEQRAFDSAVLDELAHPPLELAEFSSAFRRFAKEISFKRRQEDELAGAAIIQKSFLPKPSRLSALTGRIDLFAAMRPARDVGGDFYDYFVLDENRLAFCIGDICGKGISASIFMSVVITTLRTAALEEASAGAIMQRANAILSRDNAACMFATVFFGIVDLVSGKLDYCNCGHNPPYVVGPEGRLTSLPATGLPMALYAAPAPRAESITLQPADTLLLFTDGVTEAMNLNNEEFGEEALAATLAREQAQGSAGLVSKVFAATDQFADGAEQADDITLLAFRRLA